MKWSYWVVHCTHAASHVQAGDEGGATRTPLNQCYYQCYHKECDVSQSAAALHVDRCHGKHLLSTAQVAWIPCYTARAWACSLQLPKLPLPAASAPSSCTHTNLGRQQNLQVVTLIDVKSAARAS